MQNKYFQNFKMGTLWKSEQMRWGEWCLLFLAALMSRNSNKTASVISLMSNKAMRRDRSESWLHC